MEILKYITNGGAVLQLLCLLSVVALTLVINKLIEFKRINISKKIVTADIINRIKKEGFSSVVRELQSDISPISKLTARAISLSFDSSYRYQSRQEREKTISLYATDQLRKVSKGLTPISTIAQMSPMLGLLGTVVGMISAFKVLEASKMQANPSMLAGGIWEALLTTAMGLIIAIPLVAAVKYLESVIEHLRFEMALVASSIMEVAQEEQFESSEHKASQTVANFRSA